MVLDLSLMSLDDAESPIDAKPTSTSTPNATVPSRNNDDDPRAELAAVEADVERVSRQLQALVDKTHVLKSRVNNLYSSIVRLLPPEIVSEIFQAYIPTFDMSDGVVVDNSVPLFLGSICSSWRRIAWTTPTLWTSLTLRLNTTTIATQILLLDAWLSRSGDLPLSIRLISDEEIHWSLPSTPATAIEVINKYASRWYRVDLRIPTSCYKFLPQEENSSFPLLDSLSLNPPGGQGERRHRVDMRNTAKIRYLSLSCVYLVSMKFQWSCVTHLRLEAFYVDECLEALRQTPQLVSCSLRNIIGGDDGHALPDAPVVLPALKTLLIDNEKDTHISVLLDTIAIPNATDLSYSGRNLIHLSSICALIIRSSSLETFSLDQTVMSNEDCFVQLFRALKYITKFVFSTRSDLKTHTPLDDNILRLCNPLPQAEMPEYLLPKLQVLEYHGPQSFTWETMFETLESRQSSMSGPSLDTGAAASCSENGDNAGAGTSTTDAVNGLETKLPSRSRPRSELREILLHLTHCEMEQSHCAILPRLRALTARGMKVGVTMSGREVTLASACTSTPGTSAAE